MSVLRMKLRKVKTKVRRRLGHELDQNPRYLRQKELLRKTLASERLARVRVSTVDGFQGAEASRPAVGRALFGGRRFFPGGAGDLQRGARQHGGALGVPGGRPPRQRGAHAGEAGAGGGRLRRHAPATESGGGAELRFVRPRKLTDEGKPPPQTEKKRGDARGAAWGVACVAASWPVLIEGAMAS